MTTSTGHISIEQQAISILENYQGSNNYILKLKFQKESNKRFYPTRAQSDYIINYYEVTPKVAKKWVDLDEYFSKKISDEKLFTKIATQVYVEKLLIEKDTSYHIWGKFFARARCNSFVIS